MRILVCSAALAVVIASPVVGQTTVNGQLRPRYEYRDPVMGATDAFVSMRVRADIRAMVNERVRVRAQVQDVRLWGEESNTLGDFSADNFDLHQGYVDLMFAGRASTFLRVGRQELSLGGQRLVGAVDWTQQGRSFDGLRFQRRFTKVTVNLFGFVLADSPGSGPAADAHFSGVHTTFTASAGMAIDVFGFFNRVVAPGATNQVTVGFRSYGAHRDRIVYRVEGAYQAGERGGSDVAAFMLGARLGTTMADGTGSITLWWDYLSGDTDPADSKTKVFDTLFATNHKFYGFADLFLNISAHTGGLGLQDIAAKGSYRPRDNLRVNLDVHTFRLAKQGALASSHLGEEVDIGVTHQYEPSVTLGAGVSYVMAGSALGALGRLTEDMTYMYLSLNTVF